MSACCKTRPLRQRCGSTLLRAQLWLSDRIADFRAVTGPFAAPLSAAEHVSDVGADGGSVACSDQGSIGPSKPNTKSFTKLSTVGVAEHPPEPGTNFISNQRANFRSDSASHGQSHGQPDNVQPIRQSNSQTKP